MMTLAVTGAPGSHRGPVLLAGPDGQRVPDCPDVRFCRFCRFFSEKGCTERGLNHPPIKSKLP